MGNCCRKASAMEWAGDDWGSLRSSSTRSSKVFDEGHAWKEVVPEKKKLLEEMRSSSSDHNGRVTIKISKKELEELMGGMGKKERDGRVSSAEQVLFRLLSARDHHVAHHRPWRPVLQSIPELD